MAKKKISETDGTDLPETSVPSDGSGKPSTRKPRTEAEIYGDHGLRIYPPGAKPYWRLGWHKPTGLWVFRNAGRARDEALRRAKQWETELDAGFPTDAAKRRATTERCITAWLAADHPRWSTRNREQHASRMRVHVAPVIGRRRISALTPEDMRAVLHAVITAADKTGAPLNYSRDYVANIGRSLAAWAKWCRTDGWTSRTLMDGSVSVADYVALAESRAKESLNERGEPEVTPTMVPDRDSWLALSKELGKSKLPWMELGTLVAATTGLRYGELVALRPADIELDRCVVQVRRALVQPSGEPAHFGPTKNRLRRQVGLPQFLLPMLKERIAEVENDEGNAETLLFCGMHGGKLATSNFHQRALQPALKAVIARGSWDPQWGWKTLRHAAITWWGEQPPLGLGMSLDDVSATAGHKDVGFTMRRYRGFFRGYENRLAAAMSSFDPLSTTT